MRKASLLLLFSILVMILFGCTGGSYTITVGNLNTSEYGISGQYSSFNGHYFKEEKFSQDQILYFHFTVDTQEGALKANLYDSKGKLIDEIDEGKTIKIEESGTYKIQVEADHHKGGFLLSWGVLME